MRILSDTLNYAEMWQAAHQAGLHPDVFIEDF